MPTITCPDCQRPYTVAFDDLGAEPPCPHCEQAARLQPFQPTSLWTPPAGGLDDCAVPLPSEPVRRHRAALVGGVVFGSAAIIAIGCFSLILAASRKPGVASDSSPWPECESCLQKIQESMEKQGLPNALSGISWGQRRVVEADNIAKKGNVLYREGTLIEKKGTVFIFVEVRAVNQLGTRESQTWRCICENGRCTGCARWAVPH